MEKSTTKTYLDKFRDSLEDKVREFIEDIRLTDPDATDEDFTDAGQAFVEFGNAVIAKFKQVLKEQVQAYSFSFAPLARPIMRRIKGED